MRRPRSRPAAGSSSPRSTLTAITASGQGTTAWQFTGDGSLTSAPLVVGDLVFAGSSTGALYALDRAAGTTSWSTNVGSAIPADEDGLNEPLTGMGAANGTLVVPAGDRLIAYRTAAAITAAPVNLAPPTIDGQPNPGERLTADVGIWSGLPSSYTYQWQTCDAGLGCFDISGATDASFTPPTAAYVGTTLRVRIVAANGVGAAAPITSAAVAIVGAPPVNETPPTISGTAQVGQTLTADLGTWLGDPTSYTIRWQRCYSDEQVCTNVAGPTATQYTVQAADVDSRSSCGSPRRTRSAPPSRSTPPARRTS